MDPASTPGRSKCTMNSPPRRYASINSRGARLTACISSSRPSTSRNGSNLMTMTASPHRALRGRKGTAVALAPCQNQVQNLLAIHGGLPHPTPTSMDTPTDYYVRSRPRLLTELVELLGRSRPEAHAV